MCKWMSHHASTSLSQVQSQEHCPHCSVPLVLRNSQHGLFWGCSQYPKCDYHQPCGEAHKLEPQPLPGHTCPKCEGDLWFKQGRYGWFIGCSQYPECDHQAQVHEPQQEIGCPVCGSGQLKERHTRFGKVFYACDAYPECRYTLNYPPVAQRCPQCDFPVMVQRAGEVRCASKSCDHRHTESE